MKSRNVGTKTLREYVVMVEVSPKLSKDCRNRMYSLRDVCRWDCGGSRTCFKKDNTNYPKSQTTRTHLCVTLRKNEEDDDDDDDDSLYNFPF